MEAVDGQEWERMCVSVILIPILLQKDCHPGRFLSGIQISRQLHTGFRPKLCRNDSSLVFYKSLIPPVDKSTTANLFGTVTIRGVDKTMAHAARITRPRLTAVSPVADYCLNVCFVDGSCGTVNMKDSIFSLSGLAPLRDPVAFSRVVLGEYGWEAEWSQLDIQIGADTLFVDMLVSVQKRLQTVLPFGEFGTTSHLLLQAVSLVLLYVQ